MSKEDKPTFFVYFEQVNQSRYKVNAKDPIEAVKIARRMWRSDNDTPELADVEQVGVPRPPKAVA